MTSERSPGGAGQDGGKTARERPRVRHEASVAAGELSAVSRGLANKQIARELRLREATVKTHLEHIFAKLGVSDRTAAATLALQRGAIRL